MPKTEITDELLMAYADGALSDEQTADVDAAIAHDPALMKRVELFQGTMMHLSALGRAQPADVPDGLEDRVRALGAQSEPTVVIDLAERRRQRQVPIWQLPLAASLFLAIGIAGTLMTQRSAPGDEADLRVAGLDQPALRIALGNLPSGTRAPLPNGGEVLVIASFTDAEGALCREVEFDPPAGRTIVTVACYEGSDWDVRFAVAAAPVDATGYAPASSLEALDAYLAASQAGAPMPVEQERAALDNLVNSK